MFQRAKFRAFCRRNSDQECCRQLLRNGDAFDAALDGLEAQHAAVQGGPLQDFLSWLLANQDQIIAFIKQIVALFSP